MENYWHLGVEQNHSFRGWVAKFKELKDSLAANLLMTRKGYTVLLRLSHCSSLEWRSKGAKLKHNNTINKNLKEL